MELTVELDDEVYDRLETRADRHEFASPEDYAGVIITTVIDELENDKDDNVRARLEDLGYL